jgi:hypothetical protein
MSALHPGLMGAIAARDATALPARFAQTLRARIDRAIGTPMAFPTDYCATDVAAILRAVHGIDLLGNAFGGAFAASEDEALARYRLGLAVVASRRLRALGFRRVHPQVAPPASVAIVRVGAAYGHGLAIATGTGFFARRSECGHVFHRSEDVVACYALFQQPAASAAGKQASLRSLHGFGCKRSPPNKENPSPWR